MPLAIESLTHTIADGADERCLFKELNLTIGQGECVALMGDSGSGKTTLLNLIAGLEPIQQGDIRISGQSLSQATEQRLSEIRKSQIGIIFSNLIYSPALMSRPT